MEKISMWSDLDAIGEKLGYPIYLFQGGYCAKSMVCENQTAIAVVRKLPRSGKLQVFMASEDFPLAQFDVLAVPFSSDDREDEWDLEKATLQVVNGRKIEDFRLAKVFLLQGQGAYIAKYVKAYPYLAANEVACFLRNPQVRDKVVKDWLLWHAKHLQTLFSEGKPYLVYNAAKIVSFLKLDLVEWFVKTFLNDIYGTDVFAETEQALLKRCLDFGRVDLVNMYLAAVEPLNGFYGVRGGSILEFVNAVSADNPKVSAWYANEYLPRTTSGA